MAYFSWTTLSVPLDLIRCWCGIKFTCGSFIRLHVVTSELKNVYFYYHVVLYSFRGCLRIFCEKENARK